MCGILGQVKLRGHYSVEGPGIFREALQLLKHRGPDGFGVFSHRRCRLGHRRLSIIDLGAQSDQPMISSCKNFVLVFNGEIYNYKALRQDLVRRGYTFKTNGDSEVLLNSFIEFGIDCIQSFVGMFSFAIFDKSKETVYLVRDRLGIKPLYYTKSATEVIFASEIKPILKLDASYKRLNDIAISSYLSFRYPILDDTFFKDVQSLAPGHYIKIQGEQVQHVQYWDFADSYSEQQEDRGESYYTENLKAILGSSVAHRMVSDVPVGAFLSGGADSSIITMLMSELSGKPISTYTIGFPEDGFNEFSYAKLVANQLGTDHNEITLKAVDYLETMKELISYKDAPLSVPNEVPLYIMCQHLREKISVVLSGEGADEIFGGYGRIFRSPLDYWKLQNPPIRSLSESSRRRFKEAFSAKYDHNRFSDELSHFMSIYSYTSKKDQQYLLNDRYPLGEYQQRFRDKLATYFQRLSSDSYTNRMMYTFGKVHLPGLLHRLDTTSMATSIEGRVPFVDHRLIEFAATIPVKYKLKWKTDRRPPYEMMSDQISERYDIPKYILKKCYNAELPKEVLYRKKVGFPVPLATWFGGDFQKYATDILLSKKAQTREIFDIYNLQSWLNKPSSNQSQAEAMKIWMLINIELFLQQYLDE